MLQDLLKWLRTLGPVGSFAANAIQLLTTNWVLTVSTLGGLWASLNDTVVAIADNQRVHTAILVFLTILWTSVGIAYLVDRRKARAVKPEQDFRYGLTFEGLSPVFQPDETDTDEILAFAINLRNFSSGPIRYTIDVLDVRIGSRALPKVEKNRLTSFMPRGGGRQSTSSAFSASDVKDFHKRSKGTLSLSIVYGHPEAPPVRRLTMELGIVVQIKEVPNPQAPDGKPLQGLVFGSNIIEESDVAIA